MNIDKAENTTVRYTEDGTDPDASSTKAETNSVSFYSNTPEFKEVRFAAFDEEGKPQQGSDCMVLLYEERTGCIRAWKLFSRSGWNYSIC